MPSVKTGLHHRRYLGFFKILGLESKHFALFYGQCVVVHVGPRIIDQFVALMLPDHSLYLQRRGTLDVTPAVATVGRIEGVLNHIETASLRRERHRKQVQELQRFKLIIDHLVQSRCQFTHNTHMPSWFIAYSAWHI